MVGEWAVTFVKQRNGWRMSFDVGKATEGLENELRRWWSDGKVGKWAELIVIVIAELILQPFRPFTNVTAHSPSLPSLYPRHNSFFNHSFASSTSLALHCRAHSRTFTSLHLRHSSFSNPSVALPTSQLILQPFRCFTNVTVHSPTLISLLLRHRLFTYVTWRAAHDS